MNTTQQQKGFTIIEVVLVLAIAGLIFAMIFIAWPALQRSQRDTARKNDAATVASAIGSYKSNNNGKVPTTTALLVSYIDNLTQYDKASTTELILNTAGGTVGTPVTDLTTTTQLGLLRVMVKAKCDPASAVSGRAIVAGSSRQVAIQYRVEANGVTGGIQQCQDA